MTIPRLKASLLIGLALFEAGSAVNASAQSFSSVARRAAASRQPTPGVPSPNPSDGLPLPGAPMPDNGVHPGNAGPILPGAILQGNDPYQPMPGTTGAPLPPVLGPMSPSHNPLPPGTTVPHPNGGAVYSGPLGGTPSHDPAGQVIEPRAVPNGVVTGIPYGGAMSNHVIQGGGGAMYYGPLGGDANPTNRTQYGSDGRPVNDGRRYGNGQNQFYKPTVKSDYNRYQMIPPPGTLGKTYQQRSRSLDDSKHPRVGIVEVRVPEEYDVSAKGMKAKWTGEVWRLESDPLIPGNTHIYDIRVENGGAVQWRTVRLIMGRIVDVDF